MENTQQVIKMAYDLMADYNKKNNTNYRLDKVSFSNKMKKTAGRALTRVNFSEIKFSKPIYDLNKGKFKDIVIHEVAHIIAEQKWCLKNGRMLKADVVGHDYRFYQICKELGDDKATRFHSLQTPSSITHIDETKKQKRIQAKIEKSGLLPCIGKVVVSKEGGVKYKVSFDHMAKKYTVNYTRLSDGKVFCGEPCYLKMLYDIVG